VKATFSKGTADTYQSYWRLAVLRLGDRRIDSIGVDDCEAIVAAAVERARRNRPGTEGRSARENCIGALRALFARAERAGLIAKSPAADLDKPRRLPNRRRALEDHELREDRDTTQDEGTPKARCESESGSAGATGPVTSALTKPASLELRHLWCQRSTRMEHSGPGASPSRPSPVRSSQSRVSASATYAAS
jgi:hypothetical protein